MNGVGYASPTYHALSVVMLLLCSLFLLSWLLVVGLEARSLRFKAMALATVKGPSSHRNGRAGAGAGASITRRSSRRRIARASGDQQGWSEPGDFAPNKGVAASADPHVSVQCDAGPASVVMSAAAPTSWRFNPLRARSRREGGDGGSGTNSTANALWTIVGSETADADTADCSADRGTSHVASTSVGRSTVVSQPQEQVSRRSRVQRAMDSGMVE